MDILKMTFTAIQNNQLINLLRGDNEYMIETSQYAPEAGLTDVGKVLSRGIYKLFEQQIEIKTEYENSLMQMMDKTNFDVYLVCLYIVSQLFKEKNNLSPFILDKTKILVKLRDEILKRKKDIMNGIIYPSGYKNTKAWDELERFKKVCKEEYQIDLF